MRMGDSVYIRPENSNGVEREGQEAALIWTVLQVDGDRTAIFRDTFSGCEIRVVLTARLLAKGGDAPAAV